MKGDEEVTLGPGGFVRIPPELPELVAKANGAVLGPPLNPSRARASDVAADEFAVVPWSPMA